MNNLYDDYRYKYQHSQTSISYYIIVIKCAIFDCIADGNNKLKMREKEKKNKKNNVIS